jgi:hypothetical protein
LVVIRGDIGREVAAIDVLVISHHRDPRGVGFSQRGGQGGVVGGLHNDEGDPFSDQFPHLADLRFDARLAVSSHMRRERHAPPNARGRRLVDALALGFQPRR